MIDKYIKYLQGIRRYSARTCEIYREILDSFLSFTSGQESLSDKDTASVCTGNAIRNYEVHLLDDRKESARTVNLHMSVISGFCRFLMKEGLLESNPVRLLSRPKTEKWLPVFYREESMREYFDSTEYIVSEENLQIIPYRKRLNRLIISILYNTGIRRSELISLKLGNVDFQRHVMRVTGKGDKMREIPLIEGLCKEISLYLQTVDSMAGCQRPASGPLLVTEKGASLYPVYVDRTVKSELGAIGSITGRKSPHVLRHTIATELLNDGTDLNSIKELLGHSSLAATQVYTHNSVEKLKTIYNNAHPRAKSGGNYGDKD